MNKRLNYFNVKLEVGGNVKCNKCGRELRFGTEQVGVDKQNLPIIHRMGYCDYCRLKTDFDLIQPRPIEKKHSALSVWALILSLLGCTSVIGGLLGLVDLCINDKTKKHIGSWFALIFCALFVLTGGTVIGCNLNDSTMQITDESIEITIESESVIENTENELSEESVSTEISEMSEEEYKLLCKEMYYDDVFFGDDLSEGDYVELHLMVSENYYFDADAMYSSSFQDLMEEWNLYRDFKKCSVLREDEDSYVGAGKVDLYFSTDYGYNPNDFELGSKIVIYGEVISFSNATWDGYNDIIIIPKYIEIE